MILAKPVVPAFKYRLNMAAFICFVLGVSAVQISYIFDGIPFLDPGVLLLIPSFLFFIIALLGEWTWESKDYRFGLALLAAAVAIALLYKFKFQVGTFDHAYHTIKTVSYSIKNSFSSKFLGGRTDERLYLIDFIENIWGLAWRYIHWDYIIVLIQIFPVFVLWRQLVEYFRNRGIEQLSGFLSAIIILSMQIIWAQACSTLVDSLAGMIAALTLLRISDLLSLPESRHRFNITATAFLSILCLLPKPSLIFLALLGLGVSGWFAATRLSKRQVFITFLILLPSVGFGLKHYCSVWIHKGTPFYPWFGCPTYGAIRGWEAHGVFPEWYRYPVYVGNYAFHFKPLYVLSSWLYDYKLGDVIPSPMVDVGNGLLWTYLVVPILALALIAGILRIRKFKSFPPSAILLVFFVLIYYFMDVSVINRFMLGFNIFIMAWALAWILGKIKETGKTVWPWLSMMAACFVLVLACLSFFQAIQGAGLQIKVISVLEGQRQLFPRYIDAGSFQERYRRMIFKEHKSLHRSPPDDQFGDVLRNYQTLKFMNYDPKME